jgi:hypothetical protein
MAGEWRRLHNEKLHNLYATPNNIRVAKSRRLRNVCTILVGRSEGKRPFGILRRDGKIVLKWMLVKEWNVLNIYTIILMHKNFHHIFHTLNT